MFQHQRGCHLVVIGSMVLCTVSVQWVEKIREEPGKVPRPVFQLSQAQSIRYFMTFHTAKASWNTASNVCRANNGRLVTLENMLKINMLEYYKSHSWLDYSSVTPLDNTTANWHEGEPNNANQEYCVRALKEWGSWETVRCDLQLPFICEDRLEHGCRVNLSENRTIWTSPNASTSHQIFSRYSVSFEECKDKCLNISSLAKSCWAAVYKGDTNTCTLLIDSDPVAVLRSKIIQSPGDTMVLRDCFKAKINTNTIETGIEDTERIPHGCFGSDDLQSTNIESRSAKTISPSILEMSNRKYIFKVIDSQSSVASPFHSGEVSSQAVDAQIRTNLLPSTETSYPAWSSFSTATSSYIDLTSNTKSLNILLQSSLSAPSSAKSNQSLLTVTESLTDMTSCCPCLVKTVSSEESFAFISSIVKSLKVQTNTTSSYKRKHISVDDDRPVARSMGYFGAAVLAAIFGGLVLFDISTLARDSRLMLNRIKPFDNNRLL